MQVVKEIIRPATYWHVNPNTGKPEQLPVDATYVDYLNQQTKAMRAAGLSIPIPLEHQPDSKPLTPSEKAAHNLKFNTGWLEDTFVRNGKLYGLCDIQDPEIYSKLPKTIRYTSPWLTSFVDGAGKKWDGVIGHLALTSRPRIVNQEPFADAKMALNAATEEIRIVPSKLPKGGVFISRAGLLDRTPTGFVPHSPAAFSMLTGAAFDLGEMMKKEKPKEGKKPESKESEKEGKKGEDEAASDIVDESRHLEHDMEEGDEEGMELTLQDILCDVCEALWGIELPEGLTDEQQVKDALIQALTHKKKSENGMDDPMNQQKPGTSPPTVETPPMYMALLSLAPEQAAVEVAKITDPAQRQTAEAFLSLRAQGEKDRKLAEALRKRQLDAGLAQRHQRIERLSRVVPKSAMEKLLNESKSVSLSLSDEGQIVDPMNTTLEILEAGLKELPAMLLSTTAPTEVPQPKDPGGPMTPERADELADSIMGKRKAS